MDFSVCYYVLCVYVIAVCLMKSHYIRLWVLLKTGKKSALGELFRLVNHRMLNYGYKIVEDAELVEDAIQDVFVTIWRRREHLPEVKSVPAYLFVALKMRLYRILQNEQRETEGLSLLKQENANSNFVFYEEEIHIIAELSIEKKKTMLRAINLLSPQKREVIYLFFYNGMDYQEISEIMGLDIQTVRNYMSLALKNLRKVNDLKKYKKAQS